jgi:hypothetical protein
MAPSSAEYGAGAPSIFAFQNQARLAAGRGAGPAARARRHMARAPGLQPLFWNFTKGEGEVAYVQNYNISRH